MRTPGHTWITAPSPRTPLLDPPHTSLRISAAQVEGGGTWVRAGSDLAGTESGFELFRLRMEAAAHDHGVALRVEAQFGYWRGTSEPSGRITFAPGVDPLVASAVLADAGCHLGQDSMILFAPGEEGAGGAFEVPIRRLASISAIERAFDETLPNRSASLCNGTAYFYEADWSRGAAAAARLATVLGSEWQGRRGTISMISGARESAGVDRETEAA